MNTLRLICKIPLLFTVMSLTTLAQSGKPLVLSGGWQLQEAEKVTDPGSRISTPGYSAPNWYKAVVPGTVLTTLVANKVYPEPLYGENNRPEKISERLCHQSYWYRAVFKVPAEYAGKKIWINFDGINYEANIWINGKKLGDMKGAFARGIFEISPYVSAGHEAAISVLIHPQPTPGISHEHTIATGMGPNGWYTSYDGPTFLCSIGWDWIPAIRDRNSGIWQKVFLSASGPVRIQDPLVVSDLPLPDTSSATLRVEATLENLGDAPQKGVLIGAFSNIEFRQAVELAAHSRQLIRFDQSQFPQLSLSHPRLWWPNGYGQQNLYTMTLRFESGGNVSDERAFNFGIRKITYSVPASENLTLSVNGVPVICKGGNWGMDEAMKRVTPERLEAQMRMHQLANYTMIRNWVGQSTSELLYQMCDKYGLMIWDEFFQANPSDGPNPSDIHLYLRNVREKIVRFRNHPSIAVWCARNEGLPPQEIDDSLRIMMSALEPARLYQASSTDGRGVRSNGPYCWRKPEDFYKFQLEEAFKTETGTMSIPTLESIHGMMPKKDWEEINDDWAEHDFARGAQNGNLYPRVIETRFGKIKNLADFVRKSQLANYESYRAMYEGRFAKLFNPVTGVLTWMSHPSQPSFVWQLYHYDLEPNASLFGVKKACEQVHVQLNEKEGNLEVINALPAAFSNGRLLAQGYDLKGNLLKTTGFDVNAKPGACTELPAFSVPDFPGPVYLVRLKLTDKAGALVSDNFYWRTGTAPAGVFTALDSMELAGLDANLSKKEIGGRIYLEASLTNNSKVPALMVHFQLRRQDTRERVLPVFYSDNYVTLMPGEQKIIQIEASQADLKGEAPLLLLDGWNLALNKTLPAGVAIAMNEEALPSHWPVTGLPFSPFNIGER